MQGIIAETNAPQYTVRNLLCFDMWLEIAEMDAAAFASVRSINKDVRDYTNAHMDEYKRKFAFEVTENKDSLKHKYYRLPSGDFHGLYQTWYSENLIRSKTMYTDGQINGESKLWHNNGNLCEMGTVNYGAIVGLYQQWYTDGNIYIEARFSNGKKNGMFRQWYHNGSIHVECTYSSDIILELRSWDIAGNLREQYRCSDIESKGLHEKWDEHGELCFSGNVESSALVPPKYMVVL